MIQWMLQLSIFFFLRETIVLCFVTLPLWVSYLKICSLPCFSPVNINYVPCEFLGTEFEIAPANRLWPGVYLNAWISPRWMNCVFCPEFTLIYWLAGRSWCCPLAVPEEPPKEKIQEYRGWWGGSPDLSEWRRTKCKMYRIFFNTY